MVERLSEILGKDEGGGTRGEVVRMGVAEDELALARRRVERIVTDTSLSNAPSLSERHLGEAISLLEGEERRVSDVRSRVMAVHDRLQDELKRRFKEDLSQISTS